MAIPMKKNTAKKIRKQPVLAAFALCTATDLRAGVLTTRDALLETVRLAMWIGCVQGAASSSGGLGQDGDREIHLDMGPVGHLSPDAKKPDDPSILAAESVHEVAGNDGLTVAFGSKPGASCFKERNGDKRPRFLPDGPVEGFLLAFKDDADVAQLMGMAGDGPLQM